MEKDKDDLPIMKMEEYLVTDKELEESMKDIKCRIGIPEEFKNKKIETNDNKLEKEQVIDQLKEPDVLVYVGKCYSSDMGYSAIARAVKRKYNIEANNQQIKQVIAIFQSRKSDLINGSNELQEMVKGVILDTKSQLERINNECWKIFDEFDKKKESEMKLAAMRDILKQLEFQERLLTRLSSSISKPKINKLEMTQIIVNSLDDLEKQGVIKILKPLEGNIGINSNEFVNDDKIVEVEVIKEAKDAS